MSAPTVHVVNATMRMSRTKHVDMAKRVRSNAAQAGYNFARGVVKEARIRVPKRTGYLMSQIKWERTARGKFIVYVDGDVNARTGAFYAVYVEYGTRNMAAQPFFHPAIAIMKQQWQAEMKAVFR